MFFASTTLRKRKQSHTASKTYDSLERRQLLTFLPPPPMTTVVSEFAQSVDDAVVRVDNDRLIIRTTGDQNRIEMQLGFGYLQVNRDSYNSLALEIDPNQYSSIVLLSGGEDVVRVSGSNLTAQMHPDRMWVSASIGPIGGDILAPIDIHGRNFEHVEVNQEDLRDYGPYILQSNNRIRMYGNEGVDRLNMTSKSNFAIATGVTMTGEGYYHSSNVFGDLYVNGGGGDDFASLAGTRGFLQDAVFVENSTDGSDVYTGRDNWSRIQNELWDARFLNFETQRVDLLSGEDRSIVEDSGQPAYWYRVDGNDLIGGYRRMINVELIEIVGSDTSSDSLVRPEGDGVFSEKVDSMTWSDSGVTTTDPLIDLPYFPPQILPEYFEWKFVGFDRLVG